MKTPSDTEMISLIVSAIDQLDPTIVISSFKRLTGDLEPEFAIDGEHVFDRYDVADVDWVGEDDFLNVPSVINLSATRSGKNITVGYESDEIESNEESGDERLSD